MANRIKALSGPAIGQEFPVVVGLSFGRSKGEVRLDDGKVSSLHAFVAAGPGGILILTDNGSKNGIKVGGNRVQSLILEEGARFYIGASEFEVISGEISRSVAPTSPTVQTTVTLDLSKKAAAPAPDISKSESSISEPPGEEPVSAIDLKVPDRPADVTVARPSSKAPALPEPAAEDEVVAPAAGRKWNDVLAAYAADVAEDILDQPKAVVPFNPPMKFVFIGGLQAETEWTLGYGPRRVGTHSLDLPILEPSAPDICFELVPSPEGVTFRTNYPKNVRLNGAEVKLQTLKAGDIIGIGQTQIEVEILK